jgi:hypothetical protein
MKDAFVGDIVKITGTACGFNHCYGDIGIISLVGGLDDGIGVVKVIVLNKTEDNNGNFERLSDLTLLERKNNPTHNDDLIIGREYCLDGISQTYGVFVDRTVGQVRFRRTKGQNFWEDHDNLIPFSSTMNGDFFEINDEHNINPF